MEENVSVEIYEKQRQNVRHVVVGYMSGHNYKIIAAYKE
jgi:hypothetical protein